MKRSLSSLILAGSTLLPSCTYLHPKGKPIFDSLPDSVSQNDGRYSIPTMNISNLGWIQPELSDRVLEGELPIMFKPLKGSAIVKDVYGKKDWDLETDKLYVLPVYFVGEGHNERPATETSFRIGGPFGIPIEVTKPEKGLVVKTFTQADHKYRPPTMLIDMDRNPDTPKVEVYIPVIRDDKDNIVATLLIEASKAKEVIDFDSGRLTLRTAPGDIHYFSEIPSTEYYSRPITAQNAISTQKTESPTVIVK